MLERMHHGHYDNNFSENLWRMKGGDKRLLLGKRRSDPKNEWTGVRKANNPSNRESKQNHCCIFT